MSLTDILKIKKYQSQIQSLQQENIELSNKINSLEGENYFSIQGKVGELNSCYDQRLQESQTLSIQIRERFEKIQELDKQIIETQRKLTKIKEMYHGIESAVQTYKNRPLEYDTYRLDDKYLEECEKYAPSIRLSLACMNNKELHDAYIEKEKIIGNLFKQYEDKFTTSSDNAIYGLLILSLKAEIQNILYSLKDNTTTNPADAVKHACKNCFTIACKDNRELAETMTSFLDELEYHLVDLVNIEKRYCEQKKTSKTSAAYQ